MSAAGRPVRIHRTGTSEGNFVQIPNTAARDKRLTYRERGILAEILSYPDDWVISAARIASRARSERNDQGEGLWIVERAFRRLEACGYLERRRVRGPRGRLATELHFYDKPAGHTGQRSADGWSSDGPVTGTPVSGAPAPGTPDASTPDASTPDAGRPVTGPPGGPRSLRRPRTKTTTKTGPEHHPLSLGDLLPQISGLADGEREEFAEWMVRDCRNPAARREYLRKIIRNGDLAAQLAEFRGSSTQATGERPDSGPRQGPDCPHGEPGGAGINPRSGKPWCPMCRNEARAGQA